jgi:hypothetical protein
MQLSYKDKEYKFNARVQVIAKDKLFKVTRYTAYTYPLTTHANFS